MHLYLYIILSSFLSCFIFPCCMFTFCFRIYHLLSFSISVRNNLRLVLHSTVLIRFSQFGFYPSAPNIILIQLYYFWCYILFWSYQIPLYFGPLSNSFFSCSTVVSFYRFLFHTVHFTLSWKYKLSVILLWQYVLILLCTC